MTLRAAVEDVPVVQHDMNVLLAGLSEAQREVLAAALRERGLKVSPSQTNFLLVEFGDAAGRIEAALIARGIVLRPMGGYGLGECLRITVGTEAENARLLETLGEVLT